MNRYPVWKFAIIVIALLLGVVYTVPNFFGEAPAVQVSSNKATLKIDQRTLDRVQRSLNDAGISAVSVGLEGASVRARFENTDKQLRAKDALQTALINNAEDPDYIVALNLISNTPKWLAAVGAQPMYLGLDLRGGVHFMLQVNMEEAIKQAIVSSVGQARSVLKEKGYRYLNVSSEEKLIVISFQNKQEQEAANVLLSDRLPLFTWSTKQVPDDFKLVGIVSPKAELEIKSLALKQNIETLHKRVNLLGVAEPVIQQQGSDRIVVQLPGVQDTARAKSILGKTATLQVRLVDESKSIGAEVVPMRNSDGSTRQIFLKREVIVTGDQLRKAAATIDKDQRPAVSVELDSAAGRIMRNVTRENINKPMAFVLYEKGKGEAISVANIQGEFGDSFQISGNFTPEETADLAVLTKSGSLAAPMEIIEERTIGPSLGAENIAKGFNSVYWGFLVIVVFMCIYYMMFGMFSSLALGLNLLLLIAALSMLQATLTLPGMAAMALALGMAIDSNVLINERVREELRSGASPQAAIHAGYDRAWATILDSNITTLIAGLALLTYGSGPVKGFAVVHCLGILTSMFSAVFFSRGLVNLWYGRQKKLKSVSIGTVWRPDGSALPATIDDKA